MVQKSLFGKSFDKTNMNILHYVFEKSIVWAQHNASRFLVGHWLDMVYPSPPPQGEFVDLIFLADQCFARILQHVSPLTMAALSCNSLLHTLPYKIFYNKTSF